MTLLSLRKSIEAAPACFAELIEAASIEVTPRTAAKIEDFGSLLLQGMRVYIAHVDGVAFSDMLATAKRLAAAGFEVMPHVPARSIPNSATLANWLARYQGEAGVDAALVIAGGRAKPLGAFQDSIQLLETGLFDNFRRIHVAGHPEGNRDIAPDGSKKVLDETLLCKQRWSEMTGVPMAIVTQFVFESGPVVEWIERLRATGVTLPVHIGIAGPAKLQTLIKYAAACGVGASLRVLQKRAGNFTRLVLPHRSDELLAQLQSWRSFNPAAGLEQVHVFPFGGVAVSAEWIRQYVAASRTGGGRA